MNFSTTCRIGHASMVGRVSGFSTQFRSTGSVCSIWVKGNSGSTGRDDDHRRGWRFGSMNQSRCRGTGDGIVVSSCF